MTDTETQVVVDLPTPADVPALVTLFTSDVVSLNIDADKVRLSETAQTLVNFTPAETYIRVVRTAPGETAQGVIVAHRWVSVKFSGPAYWIETLYVDPSNRRSGMGRILVEELIAHAQQTDCRGIDLEAYRMNAPASYLYRSMGFRRLGRERYSLKINPKSQIENE